MAEPPTEAEAVAVPDIPGLVSVPGTTDRPAGVDACGLQFTREKYFVQMIWSGENRLLQQTSPGGRNTLCWTRTYERFMSRASTLAWMGSSWGCGLIRWPPG